MILCLDVGNSHLFGGLIDDRLQPGDPMAIKLQFRHQTRVESTSDQLGLFMRRVLEENGFAAKPIRAISISSVVPGINYSLRAACIKYFVLEPFFLSADTTGGLDITISRFGADMVATAMAAVHQFPKHNIIVIDLGTATTYSVINQRQQVVAQVIQAGMKISMQALQAKTANLPTVPICTVATATANDPITAIQAGLYYGQLGAMQAITRQLSLENFHQGHTAPIIIATGGFAHLFAKANLFDQLAPNLVLHGLHLAWQSL